MNAKRVNTSFSVSSLTEAKTLGPVFLPGGKFKVTLDYPLGDPYTFEVKGPMTAYDLAVHIAREYAKIYKNPDKYGVWGHGIEDLAIESMSVNLVKKEVTVGVGS